MLNYKVGILGSGTMGLQLSAFFSCYNIDVIVWNHKVNNNFHKNINRLIKIHKRLGDISKDTISVRSNQDLHKARVDDNGKALLADRILYKGTYWEVKEDIDYNNLRTAHIEVLATRLDEQPMEREI